MTSGLFTRVTFKVSVDTQFGDSVFVTGNAPILGEMPPLPSCVTAQYVCAGPPQARQLAGHCCARVRV